MDKKSLKSYFLICILVTTLIALEGCDRIGIGTKPRLPPGKHAEFLLNRFARDLDLTEEQKVTLDKIKDEIIAKHEEMREEIREDRDGFKDEIISLVKSDKISKEQIYEFLERRESKKKEIDDFMIEKAVQIHDMLTPEQREKIAEKIESFHRRF